jgi:hypothetical protein
MVGKSHITVNNSVIIIPENAGNNTDVGFALLMVSLLEKSFKNSPESYATFRIECYGCVGSVEAEDGHKRAST